MQSEEDEMDDRLELEAELATLLQAQEEDADRWTLACIQNIY